MANSLYNNGREAFLAGDAAWDSDNYRVVLLSSLYTPNFTSDINYGSISTYSVALSGLLASKTTTAGVADAADLSIASVGTGSVVSTVAIFRDSGTSTTSVLICGIVSATGLPLTTNGASIGITWDNGANKIFKL